MDKKLSLFLACFIFLAIVTGITPFIAQSIAYSNTDQCIENFDQQSNSDVMISDEQAASIFDYMLCQAVAKKNINVCNRLRTRDQKVCTKYYVMWLDFFLPLIKNRSVSKQILQNGIKAEICPDMDSCNKFTMAFLNRDISRSDMPPHIKNDPTNDNAIMALIKRDASLTSNAVFKDIVLMMNAVENSDPSLCNVISNEKFRMVCFATFTQNKNTCKKCKGYQVLDDFCKQ